MTTTATITECAATSCAFNNGGCSALGVTIGGKGKASCETFVTLDIRRAADTEARVGACHLLECKHNQDLVCAIGAIAVNSVAECASYTVE